MLPYAAAVCVCLHFIRQHTSTYVRIRPYTSVYVSIRQYLRRLLALQRVGVLQRCFLRVGTRFLRVESCLAPFIKLY